VGAKLTELTKVQAEYIGVERRPEASAQTAFLKAPVGTIRAIHPVDDLTDEECALYTIAEVGAWSRPATSYLARDGVLECFKDDLTDEEIADYREHVNALARFRTGQLFSVTAESE
jgi:hypothetical protein